MKIYKASLQASICEYVEIYGYMFMPNSVGKHVCYEQFPWQRHVFFLASKTCMAVTYNCAETTARRCRGAGSACVTYLNTCWIAPLSSSAVGSLFFGCVQGSTGGAEVLQCCHQRAPVTLTHCGVHTLQGYEAMRQASAQHAQAFFWPVWKFV